MFRLSDGQAYVPIAAKISASALDWAEKHGRKEAEFDFAARCAMFPSAGRSRSCGTRFRYISIPRASSRSTRAICSIKAAWCLPRENTG